MANFHKAKKRIIYNTKTGQLKDCPKGYKATSLSKDSLLFDSKSEHQIYLRLKEQEKLGIISNLQLQVTFNLLDKTTWYNNVKQKNEAIRPVTYIADFVFNRGQDKVICDCKGWILKKDKKTGKEKWNVFIDDIYKLKKKMMLALYTPEYIFEEL